MIATTVSGINKIKLKMLGAVIPSGPANAQSTFPKLPDARCTTIPGKLATTDITGGGSIGRCSTRTIVSSKCLASRRTANTESSRNGDPHTFVLWSNQGKQTTVAARAMSDSRVLVFLQP